MRKFVRNKTLLYELKYLSSRFKPHKLLMFFFTIIGSIVVSLGDAQAFFTAKDGLVPEKWTFVKQPSNARGIAIAIVVAPSLLILYSSYRDTEEENQNISQITNEITLPFFEEDLNKFLELLRSEFTLSDSARMYIMMPIRTKLCQWHLEIITNTQNYNPREKDMRLKLYEGSIGYAFQRMNYNERHQAKYIHIADPHNLPANYIHLSQNNKDLVRRDNKGYVVIPIFDRAFLSSLLIVDTNNSNDIGHLEKTELHNKIFHWIGTKSILLSLIWRLKNHGR